MVQISRWVYYCIAAFCFVMVVAAPFGLDPKLLEKGIVFFVVFIGSVGAAWVNAPFFLCYRAVLASPQRGLQRFAFGLQIVYALLLALIAFVLNDSTAAGGLLLIVVPSVIGLISFVVWIIAVRQR